MKKISCALTNTRILSFCFLISILFCGKLKAQDEKNLPTENQKKLIAILKTLEPKAIFPDLFFLINDKGVEYFKKKLRSTTTSSDVGFLKYALAEQLLLAGKTDESIAYIETLCAEAKTGYSLKNENYRKLKGLQAIAYLRKGEQLNCIINHTAESCIYPIKGKGIYTLKEPTKKAIEVYKEILSENPDDALSKWLLNIGYMSIGTYPDSVPKKYFIPYNTLDSDYKLPEFKDVSAGIGLDVKDYAGSVIVEDFNNDNYLDFFMDAEGFSSPCRVFINKKDGTFEDKTSSMGLDGEVASRVALQADYNNDGFIDIFVCRGAWFSQENNFPPNSLFKNNGDGTFTDVTIESGLLSFHPTSSASWGDFDNDGFVDLFVGNETKDANKPHRCQLYHNNGDGTFKEVSNESGIDIFSFVKSVSWGDYNNDGLIDLFATCISGDAGNVLYKNNGKGTDGKFSFSNVTTQAGVSGPKYSFPSFFFDFDNDGWLDIFIAVHPGGALDISSEIPNEYLGIPSNKNFHPVLYRNNHDGTFSNIGPEIGLNNILYAMSCTAGDIDNDGFQDIYSGTGFLDLKYLFPKVMLRNNNGKSFQNVTSSMGLGHLQKAHGIGFGDIDNDGDQDILLSLGAGFTTDIYNRTVYENPGNTNHWVSLKLEGKKSNRSALGSRIKVTVETESGTREIYNTVASTGSFGNSCLRREIGLGDAKSIKSIEVFWPASGIKQVFNNVPMDLFYAISEDASEITPLNLKKIKLAEEVKNKGMKH